MSGLQFVVLRLIEVIAAAEDADARLNRPVKQIRLREPQTDVALLVAHRSLHIQRLAQAKQVVRGIVQANERARQSAHAARQANAVLAFFFHLQRKVN